MQLIFNDENAVDTYVTMATCDESPKDRVNGANGAEDVNECNGNKENVENIKPDDILCDELGAAKDIVSSKTGEVIKDAISSDNSPVIGNIECEHVTDILKDDEDVQTQDETEAQDPKKINLKEDGDVQTEAIAEAQDPKNSELKGDENVQTQPIADAQDPKNNEPSPADIKSSADHESFVVGNEVDQTSQENTNGVSNEEMDVDKSASQDVLDKSKTENKIATKTNNISTELMAPCQENNTQEDGIQEDCHDDTMVEQVSPLKSLDKKVDGAIVADVNIEENLTATVDKESAVVVLENTIENGNSISHTKEETDVNVKENMQLSESNHTDEESVIVVEDKELAKSNNTEEESVKAEEIDNSNQINLENKDSQDKTSSTNNIQEEETKGNDNSNTISSTVDTLDGLLKNKPEAVKPMQEKEIYAEKENNIPETQTSPMEVDMNEDVEPSLSNNIVGEKELTVSIGSQLETDVPKKTLEDLESQLRNNNSETITNIDKEESNKAMPILKDSIKESKINTEDCLKEKNENIKTAKKPTRTSRLSNTLDILSDDEEEEKNNDPEPMSPETSKKQCINLDDDDDVLLVDDIDNNSKSEIKDVQLSDPTPVGVIHEQSAEKDFHGKESSVDKKEAEIPNVAEVSTTEICTSPKVYEKMEEGITPEKPFVPENFLKTCKKSVAEMTREELEEFCVLRIVESVLDKSSLNDIKTKIKTMTQNIEEYKKKAMLLTKQNRDLQVVLKSVQEELKKNSNAPITPLRITRSVGMQVLMIDKGTRKKGMPQAQQANTNPNTANKTRNINTNNTNNNNRQQNVASSPTIPVPRLIPAQNIQKTNAQVTNQKTTPVNNGPNSAKKTPAAPKPEKRPRTSSQSVTVDLTDDEPPAKANRSAVNPVRLVNQQSLMAARPSTPQGASPRKVFIPISPQTQPVRPGQAIMLRPPAPVNNTAVRGPNNMRMRLPNSVRVMRMNNCRHPAPLPDHVKQYQPPNWKALPPAPDLKLSKVENGIVISWKIDGYLEDLYEEIASYQLYAYQETSVAPSTSLWKKIGDVKALPLPMACTLTQFMTGYKYYFAVRAVDIRSRVGPFSLPGSILLLNKV